MNLLFLQQNAYGAEATTVLAAALAAALAQMGHTVSVLGAAAPGQPLAAPGLSGGVARHGFYHARAARAQTLYAELSRQNLSPLRAAAKLARCPTAAFASIGRRVFNREYFARVYQKHLEHHLAQHPAQAVVAVTAPYYIAQALAAARTGAAKLVYMMDPYATGQGAFPRRLRTEAGVNRRVNALLLPPALFGDYERHRVLSGFVKKAIAVEFPGVRPPAAGQDGFYGHGKLNLAYIGSFYPTLRSPVPLFELIERSRIPNLCLTVMGKTFGTMPNGFYESWLQRLGPRLRLLPPLPATAAEAAMAGADILVNLGNTAANYVPSKLFSYISTGLPIVHVQVAPRDAALPYLEHYPFALALNLAENHSPAAGTAVFDAFCLANAKKRAPYSAIAAQYAACTPAYVANQLNTVLCALSPPGEEP